MEKKVTKSTKKSGSSVVSKTRSSANTKKTLTKKPEIKKSAVVKTRKVVEKTHDEVDEHHKNGLHLFLFGMFFIACINLVMFFMNNIFTVKIQNKPVNSIHQVLSYKTFNQDGVMFNYFDDNNVGIGDNKITIDNWSIDLYEKGNYITFGPWLQGAYGKNCSFTEMPKDAINPKTFYYVDPNNCLNSGLFLVGKNKVGKINFGSNPDSNFDYIISTLEF